MKVSIGQKDMDVIGSFAQTFGAPMPLFSARLPIDAAALSNGRSDENTAARCAVLAAMAEVKRPKRKQKRGENAPDHPISLLEAFCPIMALELGSDPVAVSARSHYA